ncbi:9377_t:CDS:2 [Funneliformis caledonium]|uniref:9377_t:CDS:1 n=1 Tax=Funneliformis caledonium TaxID=1117310 RepID=A0A9N8ZP97_9GLOM|nr:9377_t:CDS:2 [Funneliformis caledonium]
MSRDKKDKNWLESQIQENHIKCIAYSEFSDLNIVGEGGSGSVYKASWKSRRMIVALKFFKSDANDQETDKTPWKEFIRELTNLRNIFYHPHINQFIGITKGGYFQRLFTFQAIIMRIAVGDRENRVDGTPEPYFQLYSKCWKCDPEERPDITEVVETLENFSLENGDNALITNPNIPTINLPSDALDVDDKLTTSVPSSISTSNPTTMEINLEMSNNSDLFLS